MATANKKIVVGPISIEYLTMTPSMAKDILEKNQNRSLRVKRVREYSTALKNSEWQFNGDTIVIDKNDILRDGQHRLEACVSSGVEFDVILVRGVEPKSQTTMDSGSKRTISDTLELAGYDEPQQLAAALALLYYWETQGTLFRHADGALTANKAVAAAQRHPDIYKFIKLVKSDKLHTAPAPSSFIVALYLCHRGAKNLGEDAERRFNNFTVGMIQGLGLDTAFDPRLQLRNRFQKMKEGEPGRDSLVAASVSWLTIRAWEYYFEEMEVTKFQIGSRADFTFAKHENWRDIPGDKLRFSLANEETLRAAGRLKAPKTAKSERKLKAVK